ncbi:MAG: hypothetical protein ACJ76Y_21640 [Thermoanaerobaculia bacterium]
MSLLAVSDPSLVRAAKRRLPATVALDLRAASRVAAVAVSTGGGLAAWAIVSGSSGGEPVALARRALRELRVRPRKVRVLLGGGETQVTVLSHAGAPDAETIAAALFAEGYERLSEPSVAALPLAPDTWLVAACGAGAVEPLAAGLLLESGAEPAFTVDQLLAAAAAGPGAALELVESGEAALLASLAGELPEDGGETLPAACGPAWRLALQPDVPELASPRSERRRTSLAWARRGARAALVLAVLGALLMAAGLRMAWAGLASRTPAARAADARLVQTLRETGELAGEVETLRAGLAGQRAPWPRLAELAGALARRRPPEVAWERLQVKDGALELEASAAGQDPFARLQSLRHDLEGAPGIANLSWSTPAADRKSGRLRQVFRAALREMPAAAPRGEP